MTEVEKLARRMTNGDPDRLVSICYDEVIGRSETGGAPKVARRTAMIPAWKMHEADAWLILYK